MMPSMSVACYTILIKFFLAAVIIDAAAGSNCIQVSSHFKSRSLLWILEYVLECHDNIQVCKITVLL